MTSTMTVNPIELLKKDHAEVKQLFEKFEKEKSHGERSKIARKAMKELKIHAEIEEKIFYPAFEKKSGAKDA